MIKIDKYKHELAEIGMNLAVGALVLLFFAVIAVMTGFVCYELVQVSLATERNVDESE